MFANHMIYKDGEPTWGRSGTWYDDQGDGTKNDDDPGDPGPYPPEPSEALGYFVVLTDIDVAWTFMPDPEAPVVCARFSIRPDAPEGVETPVTLEVLAATPEPFMVLESKLIYDRRPYETTVPDLSQAGVQVTTLSSGKVKVLAESGIFLRGDANTDFNVDVADAITVLDHLFNSGQALSCPDAADANDDGQLDVADPVAILTTLFTPQTLVSSPYPAMGADATPDSLGPCQL